MEYSKLPKRVRKLSAKIYSIANTFHACSSNITDPMEFVEDVQEYNIRLFEKIAEKIYNNGHGYYSINNVVNYKSAVELAQFYYKEM